MKLAAQLIVGALIGIGIGVGGAMIYGLATLSLWIMERQ